LSETAALNGIWQPIAAYVDGEVLPVQDLRVKRLVLESGAYQIINHDNQVADRGEIHVNDSAVPRAMDIIDLEGPFAGRTLRAIFELDGDMLTVCYDLDGSGRPESMQPHEGVILLMITYARASPSRS